MRRLPTERLTQQFYRWESRGRGWVVWPVPVDLEPPFVPLEFSRDAQAIDDGRRPSGLAGLIAKLRGESATPSQVPVEDEPEPQPSEDSDFTELAFILNDDAKTNADGVSQLLLSLRHIEPPIAFEIVAARGIVRVQFAVRSTVASAVTAQITAHLPAIVVNQGRGWLASSLEANSGRVVDFGLASEFMLPLRVSTKFDVDPLAAIIASLGAAERNEVVAFQVLFQETAQPWARQALWAIDDGEGGSFFLDAPDFSKIASDKLRHPLFAATIRVAATSAAETRTWELLRGVGGALGFSTNPEGNSLIPLENDSYPEDEHLADFVNRRSRRSGMILSLEELVTFAHPPSSSVRHPRLERNIAKTKSAPAFTIGHSLVVGRNEHQGAVQTVSLNTTQRLRHTYVIGSSGTGKSTLLLNMILQDIESGAGLALLDPHGDLIDQVLERIPDHRIEDVVLIDAADEEYAVGFNILTAHSELEKHLLSSDLVAVFKRLSSTWGDQMTSVLGNAILAFLESSRGGTIADLRRFLVEPDFREQFLQSVQDPEIVYYWRREFPMLTGRPQAPLLTRLDTFLRPKLVRAMVTQKHDRLDFRWMMDNRKIVLGKLTQGAIGEENSYLLGTLLVTRLHQAALGRQSIPESQRVPFFLYLDEFHNFVTPSIASILSGARKFGLGLTLSHQELRQVVGQSADVASAVIANPFTRICFRLGDDDAKRLQSGFTAFDAKDLQSLGVGEAICRMERAENDFTLTTLPFPPLPQDAQDRKSRVIARSREKFGRKRDQVAVEQLVESANHEQARTSSEPKRFARPPKKP